MTEVQYREILPQRSVDDASFSKGVQNYQWSLGNPTSCIMSKSYFRFEIEITADRTTGRQPLMKDLVAPSDNCCGNLFNNAQFYAGGRQVSQIVNGLPQASALKSRLLTSSAWLESVGASAMMKEGEFARRQKMVASDAQKSSLSNDYRLEPLTDIADDQRTATVAIAVNGVVTGVGTEFTVVAEEGDTLVCADQRFQIVEITDDTTMTVSPAPSLAIDATVDAYIVRQEPTASEGTNKFFVIWQPPLGIFDLSEALPSGDYRIALNPSQDYKSAGIETLLGSKTSPTAIVNYDFKVNSLAFYLCTVKMTVPKSLSVAIWEHQVQSKNFRQNQTLNFTVPASSKAFSVWVASDDNGKNTLIPPSMFKVFPTGGVDDPHLRLDSLQLTYSNMSKPSVRWSSDYDKSNGVDKMQQRYYDTFNNAGMLSNSGGVERYEEYLARGPVYHFSFERDSNDRSTELQLSASYKSDLGDGVSLYVCSWYTRALEIDSQGGMIREVLTRTT